MLSDREMRQHDIAELMAAKMADRGHDPAHPQRCTNFFRVPRAVRAGANDLLQGDDIGMQTAEDVDGPVRQRAAIHSPTAMDVIGDDTKGFTYHDVVPPEQPKSKLQSEREMLCPCCGATLIVDLNLGRVVAHREADSGLNIELSDAQRILAEEKQRREAAFEQSVTAERTRGDALSKRFEEALKQAKEEPITKPTRDFDLD
jgi:hypothetical protein